MFRSVFFALGSSALVSCSLLIDTSVDGLKCTRVTANNMTQRQCSPGYSCRGEECVADRSIKDGETCESTDQCAEGLICPTGISICGKPCTKAYDINSECGNDAACVPVPDNALRGKYNGGVCLAVECSGSGADADQACKDNGGKAAEPGPGNRCVRVAQNGGMCLPACEVGRRQIDDPRGVDLCLPDRRSNPHHCGRIPSGDFVCMPIGAAGEGARCAAYPQSGGNASDDACSVGAPGLPLLCLNARGSSNPTEGELRCRRAACDTDRDPCPQSPTPQVCDEKLGLRFCKGLTE
jgi:hypothetical protein